MQLFKVQDQRLGLSGGEDLKAFVPGNDQEDIEIGARTWGAPIVRLQIAANLSRKSLLHSRIQLQVLTTPSSVQPLLALLLGLRAIVAMNFLIHLRVVQIQSLIST